MQLHDLSKAIDGLLPDHDFETDNYGQVIIYTGMRLGDNGELLKFED